MNNVIGVIFAESRHADLDVLTNQRPLAAIPIHGRYRMIDFTLSNMVNSGMKNVAVVTKDNYHSLMGHLESGKEWNLARKRGGITLFPPFVNGDTGTSDSRIDILYGLIGFLKKSPEQYVLLSEANVILNTTFNELFEEHVSKKADISVVYKKMKETDGSSVHETYLVADEKKNLLAIEPGNNLSKTDIKYYGYILINKNILISIVEQAKIRGYKGYFENIINRSIGKYNINLFELTCYSRRVTSINNYFGASMDMLNEDLRNKLFNEQPIFTKSKDTMPTRYVEGSKATNSLVADGCIIEGEIENSIIFRNVKVAKGAKVINSVIMQECEIGENVTLKNVILDKKVKIKANEELIGPATYPIVVGKGLEL